MAELRQPSPEIKAYVARLRVPYRRLYGGGDGQIEPTHSDEHQSPASQHAATPAGMPSPDASNPASAADIKTLHAFMAAHDLSVRNWVGLSFSDGFEDYLFVLRVEAEEYGKRAEEAKKDGEASWHLLKSF